MANENSNNNQKPATIKKPEHTGNRYVFASAQSNPSPTDHKEPVPIQKPKKKGK